MATITATKTVVGVFDNMDDAQNVVRELENAGFSREDVSVVANKNSTGQDVTSGTGFEDAVDTAAPEDKTAHVASDAGVGAALGGIGGLLLSFAGLAIPGVGPVLAIGPIVAALSGAGIGAVAGGIIGALTEAGIPEDEAHHYAEGVRRGHVLVTIRTDESQAERARDIMDQHGAVDVDQRASSWRERGWTGHNPGAEPLSADELRREREYYSAFERQGEEWRREQHEQRSTGSTNEGGTLEGTRWPHSEAHPIGESLAGTETSQPYSDAARETRSGTGNDVKQPLHNETESPRNYTESVETNVGRPNPATVRIEQGLERAKESAVRSARRMASRIYDRKES